MRFKKGQSGNPEGRPPGSRNKATLLIEQLLDEGAKDIGKKAIELAKAGDSTALRLCLDRIAPARRDRHISFKLPKLEKPEHAIEAAAAIVEAVAGAELTPSEAAEMMKLVEGYTRILEAEDHEQRLRALEVQLNDNKPGR
jgi:citrate lyase beta subunit